MKKTTSSSPKISPESLSGQLLDWYKYQGRDLPWRRDTASAYKVWLSEIMLQQTTVVTVMPYYAQFLERFPTVEKLAAAPLDDILHLWQGLGYYARARNLHRCAQVVTADYDGVFPRTALELEKLPGIGPYTAAAIASISFGELETVVDGNVIRVISRLYALKTPLPQLKEEVGTYAQNLTSPTHPGDYAQAIMDLGATVCTLRKPQCDACPWNGSCQSYEERNPQDYPVPAPKKIMPHKKGTFFVLKHPTQEAFWARRRPEKGLLGGMMEVPSTPWEEKEVSQGDVGEHSPNPALSWAPMSGHVQHTFTHFKLYLTFVAVQGSPALGAEGQWVSWETWKNHPWPTLMKKAIGQIIPQNLL